MAARCLIAFSLFLLAATPFTEHFWTFDMFLRGGQDFEFSLLALVVFLCLVLLLARHAQHGLSTILTLGRWLYSLFKSATQVRLPRSHGLLSVLPSRFAHRPLCRTSALPLRI